MIQVPEILRDAARAVANARTYNKAERGRLRYEFDAKYGETRILAARTALWDCYDWRNGENCAAHRDQWVIALLLAACVAESEQFAQVASGAK